MKPWQITERVTFIFLPLPFPLLFPPPMWRAKRKWNRGVPKDTALIGVPTTLGGLHLLMLRHIPVAMYISWNVYFHIHLSFLIHDHLLESQVFKPESQRLHPSLAFFMWLTHI